jgi:hypothetical protein
VKNPNAVSALDNSTTALVQLLEPLDESQWSLRYAPGKWSIKQMVQHISDTERIFGYRMLRLLRQDATELPGYDENHFADQGNADKMDGVQLLKEFQMVRSLTQWTFENVDLGCIDFVGYANGKEVTARAIAFGIVGHVEHHIQILNDRYL